MTRHHLMLLAAFCTAACLPAQSSTVRVSEGPHLRARIVDGLAAAHFAITTADERAARYFDQGLAFLHGGLEFEAERSFRMTSALDPSCASGLLGQALANERDRSRAVAFAWKAFRRRARCRPAERGLIEAWCRFLGADTEPVMDLIDAERGARRARTSPPSPKRWEALHRDLAKLARAYPDEIEFIAQAARARHLDRENPPPKGLPDDAGVLAILEERAPHHAALRYRLGLVRNDAATAWRVATNAPRLASGWRDAGAEFTHLTRFNDSAWLYEVATRLSLTDMGRFGFMPYEVDGFIDGIAGRGRALLAAGRFEEAEALATTLRRMPRHPRFPHSGGAGGDALLWAVLTRSERWDRILAAPPPTPPTTAWALAHGRALAMTGDRDGLSRHVASHPATRETLACHVDGAEPKDTIDIDLMAILHPDDAVARRRALSSISTTASGMAVRCWLASRSGDKDIARISFRALQARSAMLNLESLPFSRLADAARSFEHDGDWRRTAPARADMPDRPPAPAFGPATWTPPDAPKFDLPLGTGGRMGRDALAKRPTLLVFYLGFGCLHCVEQLNELSPRAGEFSAAGIDIVTIGSDSIDDVRAAIQRATETDEDPIPFPILCDPAGDIFKRYRCWDDFTDEALHGTFLIRNGKILWRDVSIEPFMATDFLLAESRRLLALPRVRDD